MKLQIDPTQYSLRFALTIAFCVVVIAEIYLGYTNLYSNLFSAPQELPEGNVVRVNLKSYEATLEYLEGLYVYKPEPLSLPRNNPFQ